MNQVKKYKYNLSIRVKIFVVILIILVFSFFSYLVNRELIKKSAFLFETAQQNERKTLVKGIFQTKDEIILKTSIDYRYYDWLVNFINHPDTIEASRYITHPDQLGVDLLNVYNTKGIRIYKRNSSIHPSLDFLTNKEFFKILYQRKSLNFYSISSNGLLMHVVAATVHSSLDTVCKTKPQGFLILAVVYDQKFLKKIEALINCDLILDIVQTNTFIHKSNNIPFSYYNGKTVGYISITKNSLFLNKVKELNNRLEWVFIISMVILCLITIFSYNQLVLKPLYIIQSALNLQSDKIARKLMYKRDEFGKISRMIVRFFQQRKLLDEKLNKLSDTGKKLKSLNKELSATADSLILANEEIKLQQKSTNDNIYYASAVQRAALIPSFEIDKVFRDHFILFKPRDIISGDFYWFYQHKGRYFVATADCTGHGLSGSLMSMLGISFLSQIIHQSDDNITAAEILKKLRGFIVDSLHQQGSNTEVHDGIDIGLCIFDFPSMTMEYAAAYNPLFLVRFNTKLSAYELTIFKGDSMPAGISEKQDNFSNYKINLQTGDLLYLFTDGFVDQFGGPNDKKFLTKRLKELLLSTAHLPLTNQKEIILNAFEEWKGNSYQVDDVTMISLKI
jgi:serine phosphatase RsbU (regulator of sigma subunit)